MIEYLKKCIVKLNKSLKVNCSHLSIHSHDRELRVAAAPASAGAATHLHHGAEYRLPRLVLNHKPGQRNCEHKRMKVRHYANQPASPLRIFELFE